MPNVKKDFLVIDYDVSKGSIFNSNKALKSCALIKGDNLEVLKDFPSNSIDLIYLDPPFFTRREHILKGKRVYRKAEKEILWKDVWNGYKDYLSWMELRLIQLKRILKDTGSIYLHCDWHASHLLRCLLDKIFGAKQFRSEIVWSYKRWTNNFFNFQRSHELIYFYSKTKEYKFNVQYEDYSFTTNIDQIWQKRARDEIGKSVYAKIEDKTIPFGKEKKGVPVRDVWEIPYLNPKAKERTGYPTQKPVELLLKIVKASSDEGNIVLDPCCGCGTTMVAAKILGRRWIGVDNNRDAIEISNARLRDGLKLVTTLEHHAPYKLSRFLELLRHEKIKYLASLLPMNIVWRNKDIDGFLRHTEKWNNIAVRYIEHEDVRSAIKSFISASCKRHSDLGLVILPKIDRREKTVLQRDFSGDEIKIAIVGYEDLRRKGFLRGLISNEST